MSCFLVLWFSDGFLDSNFEVEVYSELECNTERTILYWLSKQTHSLFERFFVHLFDFVILWLKLK